MHSFAPLNSLSGPAKLDNYTHDPELPQDPIQIGDYVKVHHGPHWGLCGRISWVQHPVLWVYPLADDDADDNATEYESLGPTSVAIHVDHACTDPPATRESHGYGYPPWVVGMGTGGCGCGYRFWIPTPIPIPTWWVFRG